MKKGTATIYFSSLHIGDNATWAVEVRLSKGKPIFMEQVDLNEIERIAEDEYESFRKKFEEENIRQGSTVEYISTEKGIAIASKRRNAWLNPRTGLAMSI